MINKNLSEQEYTVIFQPSGARGKIKADTNLREAARKLGVEIESVCAENATCGKCRVSIETGDFSRMGIRSSFDHVTAMGQAEKAYLDKRRGAWLKRGVNVDNVRLSCQARVCGDLLVFVPETSRGNRQIVRKSATDRAIEIRPSIRQYYVELEPATLENPLGDWDRLTRQLVQVMKRVNAAVQDWVPPKPEELSYDFSLIRSISDTIRQDRWKVSVAVWNDHKVVDVRSGYHDTAYGAAVDIGSTTIALYLCDLNSGEIIASESMMNPQVAYGEDIMSRISYASENADGLERLSKAVLAGLNKLLKQARRVKRIRTEEVLEMVIVGNSCMHHLLLSIPPKRLGMAPFVPAIQQAIDIPARELGINVHPSANIHLLPIQASFVGADNTAVLIAEEPYNGDEQVMIIDIGTNAEIVLGNRDGLLVTSTPTGPAFEGAHIEYGMRAAPGAIERVEIDRETFEPRYKIVGLEGWNTDHADQEGQVKGICGSAIIDAVAEMFRVGIISPKGRFTEGLRSSRIRKGDFSWEYVLAWENETSIGRDIPITTHDIQQIQLAKAALYVACKLLLNEKGLKQPDKIILAGGFGSYIDKTNAMILGMIPDCPLDHVYAVGNAAGDGARIALLNRYKRLEACRVVREIRRIELPIDPNFQNQYMLAINFPHMSDVFPSIEDLIPQNGPDPRAKEFLRQVI